MKKLINTIHDTVARHPTVKLAYLFGSQASGKTGPLSDVDVAVYLDEPDKNKRSETKLELTADLMRTLGRNKIDVVVLNDVGRPSIKYAAIAEGIRVYEVEPFRVRIEPRIVREYFDFRQSLRRHQLTKA